MRIRHVGFAAAWTVCTAAAWGDDSRTPASPPPPARPITIIASPSMLKVGAKCQVVLNPVKSGRSQTTVTEYQGVITRADDQGIRLAVTEERKTISTTSLARTPFIDRLFRNVGIAKPDPTEKKELWLPGSTIRSVRLLEEFPPEKPAMPGPIIPVSMTNPARPNR